MRGDGHPILLGRLIALLLSPTTGSATVGIVSATGIVAPLIGTGGGPEASLPVIAVGSGSLGLDWRRTPLGQSALRALRRMEVSRLHPRRDARPAGGHRQPRLGPRDCRSRRVTLRRNWSVVSSGLLKQWVEHRERP
ncbi:GntT/GntP/DsdX family permease [Streptomyces sp. NPDC002172]